MKLIYRGIAYREESKHSLALNAVRSNKEIIYRGKSSKGKINPKFPWLKYIKQLFHQSELDYTLDPITFWYDHKREFIEDCWDLGDLEKLNLAWDLTIQMELAKALKSKQKTQLKYRGVTYYK